MSEICQCHINSAKYCFSLSAVAILVPLTGPTPPIMAIRISLKKSVSELSPPRYLSPYHSPAAGAGYNPVSCLMCCEDFNLT